MALQQLLGFLCVVIDHSRVSGRVEELLGVRKPTLLVSSVRLCTPCWMSLLKPSTHSRPCVCKSTPPVHCLPLSPWTPPDTVLGSRRGCTIGLGSSPAPPSARSPPSIAGLAGASDPPRTLRLHQCRARPGRRPARGRCGGCRPGNLLGGGLPGVGALE